MKESIFICNVIPWFFTCTFVRVEANFLVFQPSEKSVSVVSASFWTIDLLSSIWHTTQVWYADDALAAGGLTKLRTWWDRISSFGPAFGYHANACKTWLVVKKLHLSKASVLFSDTEVQITTQGPPYLGAPLGSEAFTRKFILMKIKDWHDQLLKLVNIAVTQPHATYFAFVHGFVHKITFLSRTTPSIDDLLQPIEETIQSRLIPALTGMQGNKSYLHYLHTWVVLEYPTSSPAPPKNIWTLSGYHPPSLI